MMRTEVDVILTHFSATKIFPNMEEEEEACREEEIFHRLRNLFTVNDYVLTDRTVPSSSLSLLCLFFS